ncbi:MAG: hypothetical protein DRJ05_10530 [Bacteroidetes bacterium]|nr:MAG: hypothetical protein DRJ05_10530 [Bacteroidota bacterium]
MKFPKALLTGNRSAKPKHRINSKNYMYARHVPSHDWDMSEGYPDITKIKADQSFNWSAYSIPIWTRFNDVKKYREDTGIAGYSVKTIKNTNAINSKFKNNILELEHLPRENNYSHCQLSGLKTFTKPERLAIRVTFKHNWRIEVKPNVNINTRKLFLDILKMYIHRIYTKLY